MIGIIGGTGPEGFGLAVRWTMAGQRIGIGSRDCARAAEAAQRIKDSVPGADVSGAENADIARDCRIAVMAVPYSALESTVAPLAEAMTGKIIVSVVAALEWVEGRPRPVTVAEGSAAQRIQALLPNSTVTSGFQTLSAEKLGDPTQPLDEDCIICGDVRDARRETMELARTMTGIRPISGGKLENSFYPELLVGMLATINRIHKVHAGLRLAGMDSKQ